MVALDRVCHAYVNRLDKILERATSFVTSIFDCFCHVLIGLEQQLRISRWNDEDWG